MRRRAFLAGLGPLAVAPELLWQATRPPSSPARLKITAVRAVALRKIQDLGAIEPAWNPGGRMAFEVGGGSFIEIHANQAQSSGNWHSFSVMDEPPTVDKTVDKEGFLRLPQRPGLGVEIRRDLILKN